MGFFFGNFTTSFYYRIINNKAVNGLQDLSGEAPHCSVCKHPLRFYEYFPIFNLISTKFSLKCNYCGAAINPIYTALEFSCALGFALSYLLVTDEQSLILILFYVPTMLLLIALSHKQYPPPSYLIYFIPFLGILYRTVLDGNYYTWLWQVTACLSVIVEMQRRNYSDLSRLILTYTPLVCGCCWLTSMPLITLIIAHLLMRSIKIRSSTAFQVELILLYSLILITARGWI